MNPLTSALSRLSPIVVRSDPSASMLRSGSVIRITPNNPKRPYFFAFPSLAATTAAAVGPPANPGPIDRGWCRRRGRERREAQCQHWHQR